jgi:hypothetical protein
MAERFFQKIANDVLEASEKLTVRLEEGLAALFTGELPPAAAENKEGPVPPSNLGGGLPKDVDVDPSSLFEEEIHHMESEGDYGESPLEGIARSIIGDFISNNQVRLFLEMVAANSWAFGEQNLTFPAIFDYRQAGPQTAMEKFHAFRHAIAWTEPFVLSLMAFHFFVLVACLFVSRRGRGLYPRLTVMVLIAVVVRSSERLNEYGARHWQSFATQNYFDSRGVFTATMLCGPLLVFSFIMLVSFLKEASQLLVQVKTAEIRKKKRMQNAPMASRKEKKKQ